jgi:hypothetical protein
MSKHNISCSLDGSSGMGGGLLLPQQLLLLL